jgi:hypothetical protein
MIHLFDTNYVKSQGRQSIRNILHRGIGWEVANYSFYGFLELGKEGII